MPLDAIQQSSGGQYTIPIAAATAGTISTVPGRLCKILITALGTAATPIFDNASAALGTTIFVIPTSPAVGTIFIVDMPVAAGIFAGGAVNTSGFTASFNKSGSNGN